MYVCMHIAGTTYSLMLASLECDSVWRTLLKKDKRTFQLTFVLTMFGRWSLKCSTVAARLISLAAVRRGREGKGRGGEGQ